MTSDMMERIFRPIKMKLYSIIARAVVTSLDNSGSVLKVQVKLFQQDLFDNIPVLQNYGFESLADKADISNEAVITAIGGNMEMAVTTGVHNKDHRPKTLTAGEVMVYSKHGQKIHLKADGSISIDAGANAVNVVGANITLTGNVNLKDAGGQPVMLETIITKFNTHTHSYLPGPGAATPTAVPLPANQFTAGTDSAANVKAKP